MKADRFEDAAIAVSKVIAEQNQAVKGPVDVVALGSGGPVLRYAMLMAARKRAGTRIFGEQRFEGELDVEDAVVLSGLMAGTTTVVHKHCRPTSFCDDLRKPTTVSTPKPIWWQVMDGDNDDAKNPQGVSGTDWSLIALTGDRFTSADSALGMAAAHKTIYDADEPRLRGCAAGRIARPRREDPLPPRARGGVLGDDEGAARARADRRRSRLGRPRPRRRRRGPGVRARLRRLQTTARRARPSSSGRHSWRGRATSAPCACSASGSSTRPPTASSRTRSRRSSTESRARRGCA